MLGFGGSGGFGSSWSSLGSRGSLPNQRSVRSSVPPPSVSLRVGSVSPPLPQSEFRSVGSLPSLRPFRLASSWPSHRPSPSVSGSKGLVAPPRYWDSLSTESGMPSPSLSLTAPTSLLSGIRSRSVSGTVGSVFTSSGSMMPSPSVSFMVGEEPILASSPSGIVSLSVSVSKGLDL